MSLPALSDYQEAVQTPGTSFLDLELRKTRPDADPLGLPRAMSGNFAVVFPVRNGTKTWAVRCFSTFHADQEARYRAISQHLQAHPLAWMVDFRYLSQGIRARGKWYPILKMEWIEGELLNRYVSQNLSRPEVLFRMTQQFVRLVADLEVHGIAHGDLQHANLIVADDRLRLIDYDGMYVPTLRGMSSHELGHVNYQHPRRSNHHFGPYVDNFSAWVIYLSLLALSIDPKLWALADSGDEYLLFRKSDFEAPHASTTLRALSASPASTLNGIASYLTSLIQGEVTQVPRLRTDSLRPVLVAATRSGVRLPDWLENEPTGTGRNGEQAGERSWKLGSIAPSSDSATRAPPLRRNAVVRQRRNGAAFQNSAGPLPDWLGDHAVASHKLAVVPNNLAQPTAGRVILGLWMLTLPLVIAMAMVGAIAPLAAVVMFLSSLVAMQVAVAGSYIASPEFRRKTALLMRTRWLRGKRRRLEASLDRLAGRVRKLENRRDTALARALKEHQERYLESELSRYLLIFAPISGVGLILKARLYATGYRSAADIGPQVRRVPGIGPARAAALLEWRRRCEAQLAHQVPRRLPPAETAAINRKWKPKLRSAKQALSDTRRAYHTNARALSNAEWELRPYLNVTLRSYLAQVFSLRP